MVEEIQFLYQKFETIDIFKFCAPRKILFTPLWISKVLRSNLKKASIVMQKKKQKNAEEMENIFYLNKYY